MSDDLAAWLEEIGLGRFREAFLAQDVDFDVLAHLSEEDLQDLGLPLGARRRLQLALGTLERNRGPSSAGSDEAAPSTAASSPVERRQLTVMFCDLADSTALSTQVDPEDLRDILRAFQDACAGEIERFGGFVAKYMGDGVLAYFGYPAAHEDDAERSILAGLGIVARLAAEREQLGSSVRPPVRIGIATGSVVVGDLIGEGASQEAAVTGNAPNLAARLQALAEPDTLVIDEATRQLAGGMFQLRERGVHELKGFPKPCEVFTVVGARSTESRFVAARSEALTALVGRDEECDLLWRRWEKARAGRGQFVLIGGEPGIGKSRLIHALGERIHAESHHRLSFQCSPFHSNSALHPVVVHLEQQAGIEPEDPTEAALDKLEKWVGRTGRRVEEDVPLLAPLLSVSGTDRYPFADHSPQRRKKLTIEMLVAQFVALAQQAPLLLVVEDAHWIDATTEELLDLLVTQLEEVPVLIIVTHRPEYRPPWVGRSLVTTLTLNRLDRGESMLLANRTGCGEELSREELEEIVVRTDGVPLFVEELTRAVLEAGGTGSLRAIPATLQDALEARLERLSVGREVAQVGAVLGRTFDHRLIEAVAGKRGGELDRALRELVEAQLLFVHGEPPDARYTFKHALVQDTAYDSLLRVRRVEIHAAVADVLEREFPNVARDEPEVVAHHLTEANQVQRAISYWQRAGEMAAERSALTEAIHHFNRALDLVGTRPACAERAKLELALQVHLAPVYMAVEGFGAPTVGRAYRRALELAREVGDAKRAFTAQWGLWMMEFVNPEHGREIEYSKRLLILSERSGDSAECLQAHHASWSTHFFLGHFGVAREHAEHGLRLYDPEEHAQHKFLFGGHDPGACSRNFQAVSQCLLGDLGSAMELGRSSMDLAERLNHPLTTIATYSLAAMVRLIVRDPEGASAFLGRALELALENEVPRGMWGDVLQGWIRAEAGDPEQGLARMERTFGEVGAVGQEPFRAFYLGQMALLALRLGQADEAMGRVTEALVRSERAHGDWCLAELRRIRTEVLRVQGRPAEEIEAGFQAALQLAETQQARWWSLRAARSYGAWLAEQGREADARRVLGPACEAVSGAAGTVDLEEARTLLDALGE